MAAKVSGMTPLLQVFDMPTAVRFYRDALGFTVRNHSPLVRGAQGEYFHWALLRVDDIGLMLNTAYDEGQRPASPEAARVAAHGDTALFFDCPDVEDLYVRLRAFGAKVEEPLATTPYGMKRFTISDPDGYHLCFQRPATD